MRLVIILGLFVSISATGQTFKKEVDPSENLRIEIHRADVQIVGHNSSEIHIEYVSTSEHQKEDPRAEGLTVVSKFEDNTGLGYYVGKEEEHWMISKVSKSRTSVIIKVPRQMRIDLREHRWNRGKLSVQNLDGRVSLKVNNMHMELAELSDLVGAETTSGDIVARQIAGRFKVKSVSGDVEVHLGDKGYNLDVETISGSIDSDFTILKTKEYKGSTLKQVGNIKRFKQPVNGGGDEAIIESVSGKVILKAKNS